MIQKGDFVRSQHKAISRNILYVDLPFEIFRADLQTHGRSNLIFDNNLQDLMREFWSAKFWTHFLNEE